MVAKKPHSISCSSIAVMSGLVALMLGSLILSTSYAGMPRFWAKDDSETTQFNECDHLTSAQRQQLIAAYENTRDEQKKRDLKERLEWFCQLSDDEQQRMRAAWQNMSTQERIALKKKLDATNDLDKRTQIRREILDKYNQQTVNGSRS